VKSAIKNVMKEGGIGLVLTGIMILIFLGSPPATFSLLLSIPLSAVVCFLLMNSMGGSINIMLLSGLALAFSRLIDDSVVVLENIFRYMEIGESPRIAAEKGGMEVSLAVLAATSTTSIVFFPVTFFYGVSRYLFIDLALGVILSIFASYIFAMTVVPLYCAHFLHIEDVEEQIEHESENKTASRSFYMRFLGRFNERFQKLLDLYERWVTRALVRPGRTVTWITVGIAVVLAGVFPFVG